MIQSGGLISGRADETDGTRLHTAQIPRAIGGGDGGSGACRLWRHDGRTDRHPGRDQARCRDATTGPAPTATNVPQALGVTRAAPARQPARRRRRAAPASSAVAAAPQPTKPANLADKQIFRYVDVEPPTFDPQVGSSPYNMPQMFEGLVTGQLDERPDRTGACAELRGERGRDGLDLQVAPRPQVVRRHAADREGF